MGKIPQELREVIARNIRECRQKKHPGRGGGKRCAEEFGVSPQQWSPWERGMRTPDEKRMGELAEFFGVTVSFLREDHTKPLLEKQNQDTVNIPPPQARHIQPPQPNGGVFLPNTGSQVRGDSDIYWLLARFLSDVREKGIRIRLSTEDMDYMVNHITEALHRRELITTQ